MSDVIDLLERLGRDAELRHAAPPALERALSQVPISSKLQAALASGDREALEALLGVSGNVCCMIHIPLSEEDEDDRLPQKKIA